MEIDWIVWREPDRRLRNESTDDNENLRTSHTTPTTTETRNELDLSFNSISSDIISRGVIYISDLMVDLGVADEFANQILSAVIRLFN
jgi:hypothetical protein